MRKGCTPWQGFTLIEILMEQLLAKAGKQAVKGIAIAEDQLHQTGAYLNTK